MDMRGSSINVVVRLRPLNEKEQADGTLPVVTSSTDNHEVTIIRGSGKSQVRSTFKYDGVYGSYATQAEVFDGVLAGPHSVLSDVMRGYESTVFAYGQTGTGKTHTMEGDLTNSSTMGIIPRAAMQLFKELGSKRFESSHVTASYLEIYNEHLTDLLANEDGSPASEKLQIVEDTKKGGKGVHCMGLSEHPVTSPDDVLHVLQEAQRRRQERVEGGAGMSRRGKLHMVDLAGSECAKSAGSESAAQERERKNINQSLLTLGRVVEALRQKQKNPNAHVRVPYRDSKLSRLLQESLGGRCKTCIIATVSPSVLCCEETLQTLNYAQRAHGIKNKPVATSRMQMAASSSTAGSQVDQHLEANFQAMEMRCNYMSSQLDEAQSALARAHDKEVELTTRAEDAENRCDELTTQLDSTKASLKLTTGERDQLQANLNATQETLEATKAELVQTQQALATTRGELSDTRTELCTVRTAVSSFCENRGQKTVEVHAALLNAADAGKKSVASLCEKLDELHDVAEQGDASMSGWISNMRDHVTQVQGSFAGLHEAHTQALRAAGQNIAKFMQEEKSLLSRVDEGLGSLLVNIEAQDEAEKTQIESVSAAQAVVVEATGGQLQALKVQHDVALEQSKKIADIQTLQDSLQKALVTSVMEGVQTLLTQEMEKLGAAVAEGMKPIQSANETIESTSTELATKVTTMAEELDSVHDVAVQAARIWGDSGRSTAASIREITETNKKCIDTSTAAMASVDTAVESSISGASEIRTIIDTSSAQWTESLNEAAGQLAATKAMTTNAHSLTRQVASEQQGKLHEFQVYADEQATETIKCIGNHNMVQGMAEELEMKLAGSASADITVAAISTVAVPNLLKAEVVAPIKSVEDCTESMQRPAIKQISTEDATSPTATEAATTAEETNTPSANELVCQEEATESSDALPPTEHEGVSNEIHEVNEEQNDADGGGDDEADSYEMTMDLTSALAASAPAAESAEDCADDKDPVATSKTEDSTVRRLRLTAAANEMKASEGPKTRRSTKSGSRTSKASALQHDQENIDDTVNPYVPAKTAKRASKAKRESVQTDEVTTDANPRRTTRTTRTRRVLATAN